MDFKEAQKKGIIQTIGEAVDTAYFEALKNISLSSARNIKIAYSPMHGCGFQNSFAILKYLGFDISTDPLTSTPSGKFENITFNIPNPEVIQSFETPLKFATEINADILLSTDPDSDRIGIMVHHQGKWEFLNGNEIAAILTLYTINKKKNSLHGKGIVIKTAVTTNLITEICKVHDVEVIGDLLVGYKYIGAMMNKIEKEGKIDNFIFSAEESHGYLGGNYARDKDSAIAAVYLAELSAELKVENKTLVDYLSEIYSKYGYFRNYLTEIRMPGAEGKGQIDKIQDSLRSNPPASLGKFQVKNIKDYLNNLPIVSETDASSKNMLELNFEPVEGTTSVKVTIRPSGTEPKSKMYFEIGSKPFDQAKIEEVRKRIEDIRADLEKEIMKACYKIIGIDFPDRGFLLFWQLPLTAKLKYFEIEDEIIKLKTIADGQERIKKLNELLKFLGSDPIAKIDNAFKAKYNQSITSYLNL